MTHILHGEPCNIHRESLRTCANRECESANLSRICRESARIVSRTFANLSRICANLRTPSRIRESIENPRICRESANILCEPLRTCVNPSRILRELSRTCRESARIEWRTFANLSRICRESVRICCAPCNIRVKGWSRHPCSTSAERKAFEGSTLPLVAFRCGELSASTQE